MIEQKKRAAVVKDSVIYDEMDSYGDETLAESLMAAPGISAVEDAGEPRFVTIRGIQPNLNFTSLDGIAIASVGNSGSGERMNNLQLIPSDIGTRTDIYKTFGAQQAPDAIGGIIDIVSRSAFDRAGRYVFADAAGIYSTASTDVQRSAGGNHKTLGHYGKSAKLVFSDTFGADDQFGIVAVGRYQQRSRNSVKRWVESNYFFDAAGNYLTDGSTGPDTLPGWNGLRAPGNFSTGTYTNYITNFGGSLKLEWRPVDAPYLASLLMYGYRFYENSTMNKTDLYSNAKFDIQDQTADGGTTQINSIYIKNRHDRWDRANFGAIASFDWDIDEASRLSLRAGTRRRPSTTPRCTGACAPIRPGCSWTMPTTTTDFPTRSPCPTRGCCSARPTSSTRPRPTFRRAMHRSASNTCGWTSPTTPAMRRAASAWPAAPSIGT